MTLNEAQAWIGEWNSSVFKGGKERALPLVKHLAKEVSELHVELCSAMGPNESLDNVKNEAADCFILLIALCSRMGFNLSDAVKEKMKINEKRKWKAPDAHGIIEHQP